MNIHVNFPYFNEHHLKFQLKLKVLSDLDLFEQVSNSSEFLPFSELEEKTAALLSFSLDSFIFIFLQSLSKIKKFVYVLVFDSGSLYSIFIFNKLSNDSSIRPTSFLLLTLSL